MFTTAYRQPLSSIGCSRLVKQPKHHVFSSVGEITYWIRKQWGFILSMWHMAYWTNCLTFTQFKSKFHVSELWTQRKVWKYCEMIMLDIWQVWNDMIAICQRTHWSVKSRMWVNYELSMRCESTVRWLC